MQLQASVDILILGAGWTSSFLIPLCRDRSISYGATTRDGRDGTTQFAFDPDSEDLDSYRVLPDAKTVLITFPITKPGASERLIRSYTQTRRELAVRDGRRKGLERDTSEAPKPVANKWYDRHSPWFLSERADAEAQLLALSPGFKTTVLNLAGLWGGSRSTKNWVNRVAPTKEALKNKGSIHMIHGLDVSRAILAVHSNFEKAVGERWILTDGRVYDWWDLASAWGIPLNRSEGEDGVPEEDMQRGPHPRWVRELMEEIGVRALPRDVENLGRAFDSRDFWRTFELTPLMARLEG